jgi:hypothetical protein
VCSAARWWAFYFWQTAKVTLGFRERVPAHAGAESGSGMVSVHINALRAKHRQPARAPANRTGRPRSGRQNASPGKARQNYERYVALARQAALAGDRVQMENWYQHAEHYFRIMDGKSEPLGP